MIKVGTKTTRNQINQRGKDIYIYMYIYSYREINSNSNNQSDDQREEQKKAVEKR